MTNRRLSDLAILAVERDILVDYEQVVDRFSTGHKSRRILLSWISSETLPFWLRVLDFYVPIEIFFLHMLHINSWTNQ